MFDLNYDENKKTKCILSHFTLIRAFLSVAMDFEEGGQCETDWNSPLKATVDLHWQISPQNGARFGRLSATYLLLPLCRALCTWCTYTCQRQEQSIQFRPHQMTLVREENAITVGSLPHQTFPGEKGKCSIVFLSSICDPSDACAQMAWKGWGCSTPPFLPSPSQNLCLDQVSATAPSMGHTLLPLLVIYGHSANS